MSELADLQLHKAIRPYQQFENSSYKSERKFLDFVINGVSLWQLCQNEGIDNISCLWLPDIDVSAVKRLLLQEPADLRDDHRSLYVCAECGDLGCGAVSVQIEMTDTRVIWRDFAYMNDYDETMNYKPEPFKAIDPVEFELSHYRQLLLSLIQ